MNHPEREVKDYAQICEIIDRCDSLSLALFDGQYPYVVEMNFGYEDRGGVPVFYLHSAKVGKKLDLIAQNPHCAISMSTSHELIPAKVACASTFRYESVCAQGVLHLVEDVDEKCHALSCIMAHYDPDTAYSFEAKHAQAVTVLRLEPVEVTGKRRIRK